MEDDSPPMRILRIVLALALLGALVWAGARIYRRLPATGGGVADGRAFAWVSGRVR